ncbi:hypothetical protein [Pseudomonas putida]|nr:hypothetical protein [Pseudomonas putida]
MAPREKKTGHADALLMARIREAARQGAQLGYQMALKDLRKGPAQ